MTQNEKLAATGAAAARLWAARRAFIAVAFPGLLFALMIFLFTSAGHTLNTTTFVKPAMKTRNLWQVAEAPSEKLRVIVYDDSSAEALNGAPSIDEWLTIANHLAAMGYKKIIFPEVFELPPEAPTVTLDARLALIAGSAVHSRQFKAKKSTPTGLLEVASEAYSPAMRHALPAGDILHAKQLSSVISRTGAVNLSGDYEIRTGYRVGATHYIPHVAFHAAPDLRISGDRLTSQSGILPLALDGSMYIEVHDPAKIGKISIPVRSFYNKNQPGIRDQLGNPVRAALQGGEVALFVADGNTGSAAFIDSYVGLIPTYYANASLISSVMQERFLRNLMGQNTVVLVISALIFVGGLFIAPLHGVIAIVGLWVTSFAVSAVLFHSFALVTPMAQLTIIYVIMLLATQVQYSFQSWQEDLKRQRDLELGKVVQSLTLPPKMEGRMHKWEFAVAYEPHGPMSGDWVQVYKNRDDSHDICGIVAIGDVVGKGPAAALNTASIAAIWSHYRTQWDEGHFDIWNFLNTLNKNIHSTFSGNQMTSVAVAVLHKDKVQLINCGSPSWIHISPEIRVETVRTTPSNPLGMADIDFTFHVKELQLDAGSILLAHTDGVMEGGLARKTFAKNVIAAGLPEDDAFTYLKREARLAGAGTVLPDDFTMLYLKRTA